nr:unnamed protein product [Spirometra erinaceieuropaei]
MASNSTCGPLEPAMTPTSDVPSKLKLLRTNLGELGQRYFDALNLQKAIDLQTAFSKLESAWGGKDNVFLSRYRFCQMRQESNQCVSDFITNLTLAIQDCGYKEIKADNFEHAMLVQQLIVGLRDEKARENLLSEKKDLSWEKACDIASHQERVRQNLQQLNQSNDGVIASLESEMAVSLVNTAVSSSRQRPSAPSKQLPSCYRCGQHHIRWSDYRHQKTVCQFCKKVGHIEQVCFSKRRANSNTHATYPSPARDGETILRMFPANATLQSPYIITLPVDHHPVKFEIDTGSAVTLINEASLQKLPSLLPASSTFRSYTGQNVDVRGVFTAEVEHDGELHYLPVHVVRGSQQPNLLGRNWIKCVPSVLSYVHRIGVNPALDSILVNHKDLFRDDSATHYRGPPVKFQFQSDFRPRFFKARTVPYALAPKVEDELDRLQKADIIEPVQCSEWAAPIVPVLKTDGSVRICGDYKLTINSAIKLNPYPLPRIEDLSRITPNDSTGASPAELMFKRQLRTRLDLLNPSTQDRVIAKQTKMKERYDVSTRPRVVVPNESVYTRLEHETNWCPAVVRKSEGQIVELELEGTPTYGLAKWLFRRLKFLTAESDTKVSSSAELLEKLQGDLAVETIELLLQSKYDETENRLGRAQVLQLLKFCFRTSFTFDGTIYEQVKGTPMGSTILGFIAEAVLQRLESLVFQHHKPKFWARYVDDTFVVIDRDQLLTFKERLNAVFPDIQFTMEEEENNQLAFLDVLVCRKDCGGLKTKVFRKATNTMQVPNSNHPISHKRSCVRTLYWSVETHNSEPEDKIAELQYFRRVFKANGYPRNFVDWCMRKMDERPNRTDTTVWRALPYVKNDSEAVGRLLAPLGVRVSHRPEATIRRQLMKPKDPMPRQETSGVVCRIWCSCGQSNYVGETGRQLQTRMAEHAATVRRNDASSQVAAH